MFRRIVRDCYWKEMTIHGPRSRKIFQGEMACVLILRLIVLLMMGDSIRVMFSTGCILVRTLSVISMSCGTR